MITWWNSFNLIGSTAVTAPAGVAIAVWLAASNHWRLALNWACWYGCGMAIVVLSKLAFLGWGLGLPVLEFAGFSGHAMRAAAVFPVAFYVALYGAGVPARRAGVAGGVALALLISAGRCVTHFHSVSEAVGGSLLGFAVAAGFIRGAGEVGQFVVSRALVLISVTGLILVTPKVEPVPTEQLLTRFALYLTGRDRPFYRNDWHVEHRRTQLR
jgi:hypothetical protein